MMIPAPRPDRSLLVLALLTLLFVAGWPRPTGGPAVGARLAAAAATTVPTGPTTDPSPLATESTGSPTAPAGVATQPPGDPATGPPTASPSATPPHPSSVGAHTPGWAPGTGFAATARWGPPLDGPLVVLRAFDLPPLPYQAGHRGVDLRGTPGATVRAASAGVVTFAAVLAGRGVVAVTHGALRTTYEPVAATVRAGQRLAAGEPIGRLVAGHLGCAATACLHWGLLRADLYLSPLVLLVDGPPRLLPLAAPGPSPWIALRPGDEPARRRPAAAPE
jgi:murein DD-endopeptidase MepM/ murein hydrolase activator NlpD